MGPRSPGFDEIEAGYANLATEEHDEPREPEYAGEEEDETPVKKNEEMDELAIAEKEYLSEMQSGMHTSEEEDFSI